MCSCSAEACWLDRHHAELIYRCFAPRANLQHGEQLIEHSCHVGMEQALTRMPQVMAKHKDSNQATAASPDLGCKLG